jgi:hypothetical protein
MFAIAEPGKIWVWTPLTESIYPDRKAGEPVWERLRCSIYKSWADNGWVEQKAVDDVFKTPCYEELEEKIKELKQELEVCKKALRLMAKVKLSERMEQVLEEEVEKEVIWFLGMVERAEARRELQNAEL